MNFQTITLQTALTIAVSVLLASCTVSPLLAQEQAGSTTGQEVDWTDWNGTWKPIGGKFAGQDMQKAQLEGLSLTIKDGDFELQMAGSLEKGTLTLGEPAEEGQPKTIDIFTKEGLNEGKTVHAIYRFEDGKMIVCYRMDENRPTEFVSDAENPTLILEYEKQKDE